MPGTRNETEYRITTEKPTWDEYFLEIAKVVKIRSDCERDKVGSVIVDQEHRIVSTGYNGAPAGKPGCATCPRRTANVEPGSSYDTGPGACVALHAEQNAVIYGDRKDLRGATIYVSRKPCGGCRKTIGGSGIARIVYPDQDNNIIEETV